MVINFFIPGEVIVHYDSKEFERLHNFNFDQKMGSQIIQNVLKDELNLGYGTTLLVFDPGGF